jgi:hypothetical protein
LACSFKCFCIPKKGEGLDNTTISAGTNGIRELCIFFGKADSVPEPKILKRKGRMQVLLQKRILEM